MNNTNSEITLLTSEELQNINGGLAVEIVAAYLTAIALAEEIGEKAGRALYYAMH